MGNIFDNSCNNCTEADNNEPISNKNISAQNIYRSSIRFSYNTRNEYLKTSVFNDNLMKASNFLKYSLTVK